MRRAFTSLLPVLLVLGCAVDLGIEKRDGWIDADAGDPSVEGSDGDILEEPDVEDAPDVEADPDPDLPEGACTSDVECGIGRICRPACFGGDGCGTPPEDLVLTCPGTVTLPSNAACSLTLDGLAGQVGCLGCSVLLGPVVLSHDTFGSGTCSLGDWSLVSGLQCRGNVTDCASDGRDIDCCDDFSTLQDIDDGDCRLKTDRATNCGGGGTVDIQEWRITRTYDMRGLQDLEVCFHVGGHEATDDEGILLYASDSSHDEMVHCTQGMPVALDGYATPDWLEWPVCASLPAWTEGNPAVTLTFVAHSEHENEAMILDDVVVRGWPSACTAVRTTLFTEDFASCSGSITDGWNGWRVTGSNLECGATCSSGNGARIHRDGAVMERSVDTTGVDTDVRLCFEVGDILADSGEEIRVSIDTGSGFEEIWYWDDDWGPDGSCERVCLVLTDHDPAAAGNPALGIRFELDSNHNSDRVCLDNLLIDGASFCPAGTAASISAVTDEGGGAYSLDIVDDAGTPMAAYVHCSWDSPDTPIEDRAGTLFESP